MKQRLSLALASLVSLLLIFDFAAAEEPPVFRELVVSGKMPAMSERIPDVPSVVKFSGDKTFGTYGGDMRMLMARPKDTRLLYVYGYARLVAFDENYDVRPDILESVQVDGGRSFTFRLRQGHRWSDGHPFTTADFKYWWESIVNDPDLTPSGIGRELKVDGEPPSVEVFDDLTIRFSWSKPNPRFLSLLAGARPLMLYAPAHYLKQFHKRFADPYDLAKHVEKFKKRDWIALHFDRARSYRMQNPDLPTLQPWRLRTQPPSNRLVYERNPFYHRVDERGRQLPYIDRVVVSLADSKLVPAKVGAGEADLQARYLAFNNYTFLKQAEERGNYSVKLWRNTYGSQLSIFPNLNASDDVWRKLFRTTEFRRALSLAVNRHEINQVIYYGLAVPVCDLPLPESPLFEQNCDNAWTKFDVDRANQMLDSLGLTERNNRGIRLLPDGRPMEVIVETAGENTERNDILELISDSWRQIGLRLHTKPLQRDLLRSRVWSGATLMSVWSGMDNALITAESDPYELAPVRQSKLNWPKWGQYYENSGRVGEPIDDVSAQALLDLYHQWGESKDATERQFIWRRMIDIYRDEVFSIDTVYGVLQPVVVNNALRNVPSEGLFGWNPGAHFGAYRPDTFWFADVETAEAN